MTLSLSLDLEGPLVKLDELGTLEDIILTIKLFPDSLFMKIPGIELFNKVVDVGYIMDGQSTQMQIIDVQEFGAYKAENPGPAYRLIRVRKLKNATVSRVTPLRLD